MLSPDLIRIWDSGPQEWGAVVTIDMDRFGADDSINVSFELEDPATPLAVTWQGFWLPGGKSEVAEQTGSRCISVDDSSGALTYRCKGTKIFGKTWFTVEPGTSANAPERKLKVSLTHGGAAVTKTGTIR